MIEKQSRSNDPWRPIGVILSPDSVSTVQAAGDQNRASEKVRTPPSVPIFTRPQLGPFQPRSADFKGMPETWTSSAFGIRVSFGLRPSTLGFGLSCRSVGLAPSNQNRDPHSHRRNNFLSCRTPNSKHFKAKNQRPLGSAHPARLEPLSTKNQHLSTTMLWIEIPERLIMPG
jgi:hypothetical protein